MKDLQKKHYVYFAKAEGADGRIKIGCSFRPAKRLEALSIWSPFPVTIMAVAPGAFDVERSLHSYFAADRLHREWFRSSPELLFVIEQMAAGKSLSEAVWAYDRSLARAA